MHTAPERILIVRLSHLGDVVHGLPVARALRRAHPRARLCWAVQPEFAGIVAASGLVDLLISFDRRAGLAGWSRLERDLSRFSADWTIDAQGNLKSALVALAARAQRRSGLAREDWTEPYGALSLTDAAPPTTRRPDGTVHALDKMLTLARHVAPGVEVDMSAIDWLATESPPPPHLPRGGTGSGPLVILHLANAEDVRSWPVQHFEALARDLSRDSDVWIISGPSERELGVRVSRSLAGFTRVRHWVGQSDLSELACAFATTAKQESVFVGCDSGPMHVAWASGMRVVLLAGPQDARRTGPWPPPDRGGSDFHRVVRATPPPHCAPCLARSCSHPGGNVCMQRLTPESAARAVRASTRGRVEVGSRPEQDPRDSAFRASATAP